MHTSEWMEIGIKCTFIDDESEEKDVTEQRVEGPVKMSFTLMFENQAGIKGLNDWGEGEGFFQNQR